MISNKEISAYFNHGIEIAGGMIPALLTPYFGELISGGISPVITIFGKQLLYCITRPQSQREATRSATAVVIAAREIEKRLSNGEKLRDDDFFRERIGRPTDANIVIDGVLTKSKLQYEERKTIFLGRFFANISFSTELTSDDACWYLTVIDHLPYRAFLILAAFYKLQDGTWSDSNIQAVRLRNKFIFSQIHELRNLGLLSENSTFATDINLSAIGSLLVEYTGSTEELEVFGEDVWTILTP
ncbi:hypothetical protein JFR03_004312 [Aeromonas veronii]|nr:hypothetical protein [Aeromonas veronii]EKP0297477.1 hypothetical protein [Aeromonas veronii]